MSRNCCICATNFLLTCCHLNLGSFSYLEVAQNPVSRKYGTCLHRYSQDKCHLHPAAWGWELSQIPLQSGEQPLSGAPGPKAVSCLQGNRGLHGVQSESPFTPQEKEAELQLGSQVACRSGERELAEGGWAGPAGPSLS